MTATLKEFRSQAFVAIQDIQLQGAYGQATGAFKGNRERVLAELPDSDGLRDHFKRMRAATLANLGEHLETFERNATAAGAHVHWAADGAEARAIILEIARQHHVRLVTKSKSMVSEEIHLNAALEAEGIVPVETDLGEWLIQQAQQPPSHIIAPAIHMTKEEAAEIINRESGKAIAADQIALLTAEARQILRQRFLDATMGISGGNMLVAESGSIVLVENEGNIRLVTSAPKVHVAIIGLEKIARNWDDAAAWLSLLARSATGQPLSIYTSVITGPKRGDDVDGPEEVHIVLLDNGRTEIVGTQYEEALQCIRCGACLNACPVYTKAGGHAYGSPYSGPIGAVISPLLFGLEKYEALPQASSLCGACKEVCPVRIDLPRMLLALRADEVGQGILPWRERQMESSAAAVLASEPLFRFISGLGRLAQRPLQRNGAIRLPGDPAKGRVLPPLAKKPFRKLWEEGIED